jgi:CRISPR-associated protein Csx17
MKMHIHELRGCAPAPLAHYLKALGILRLVAEQADPQARGWWVGERFKLATRLDRAQLEGFFLEKYAPTPLVAPWNKGSGFFYPNDPGLTPIVESKAERFSHFRAAIKEAKELTDEMAQADLAIRAIKDEAKVTTQDRTRLKDDLGFPTGKKDKVSEQQKKEFKEALAALAKRKNAVSTTEAFKKRLAAANRAFEGLKADLIPRCRLDWRGSHREWMDAAMVLNPIGEPSFPALLGTGGNDGRLDFTNNFMQRLSELFDLSDEQGKAHTITGELLSGALWGRVVHGCQTGSAIGQYLPGMAGGANSTAGTTGDSLVNPVDFILMLEGTVLFVSHATRRLSNTTSTRAAAPFVVGAQGAGYSSSADTDESARGEQWMPLWSQPLTLSELSRLLAEGRAQIGAQTAVKEPLDLARAIASLGTARGIQEFQRYGFIERNGQANLAVPLGRFRVPENILPQIACLDDLDRGRWLHRLRVEARDTKTRKAPVRLKNAEHSLCDALFAVTQNPENPADWQAVLLALARVEAIMVSGSGFRAGPIPPLRPEWVAAANDGSAEFRLALALALQTDPDNRYDWTSSVRRHWLPMQGRGQFAKSGTGTQTRLLKRTDVVIHGRSGLDDAIALVRRRLIEAAQNGRRRLPLAPTQRDGATPADIGRLLAGGIDLDRTLELSRALMALDLRRWKGDCVPPSSWQHDTPDDAWLAIRLAHLPWPLKDGLEIGIDPAILRRLESGDAATAFELARRRLRAAGIGTTVQCATVSPETARLWAAALAFPISKNTAGYFVRRLDPNANI